MTTPSALHQRCFHHESREAASRCPSCRRYFCRECVTEHDDRVICTECLKKLTAPQPRRSAVAHSLLHALFPIAGFLVAWLVFYAVGRGLLLIPVPVHDGAIWEPK